MVGVESVDKDLTVQERSVMEFVREIMDLQRSVRFASKSRSTTVEKAAKT